MSYFASENAITEQDMSGQAGWIEIDASQHGAALDALLSGREVAIIDGTMIIRDPRPSEHHEWEGVEWVDRTPEPVSEPIGLLSYAAQKRWEKETGGIEVNGQFIDTSRESQSMITGAYAYSQANPAEMIQFKAASDWVTLDAPTMAVIATAVGAHVQACFALEATVASQIADNTITTTGEIDAAFA